MVIDVYDILQSKEDKATVPIYYEARLAKIDLKPEERPKIDPNFEEVTEDAEESTKESLRRKWAQLEAMDGKAMVVCMSRRTCVELYKAIQKLPRPVITIARRERDNRRLRSQHVEEAERRGVPFAVRAEGGDQSDRPRCDEAGQNRIGAVRMFPFKSSSITGA